MDGERPAGRHEAALDAAALGAGAYFVRMMAEGFSQTRSVLVVP